MYVKAPKEIVDYLASKGYDHRYDTSNDRQVFADGSYLLWERDFLPLCASEDVAAKLPALGCVALTAMQVRAEQDGDMVNELPEITDEALLAFLGRTPGQPGAEGEAAEEPSDEGDTSATEPGNGEANNEPTEGDTSDKPAGEGDATVELTEPATEEGEPTGPTDEEGGEAV